MNPDVATSWRKSSRSGNSGSGSCVETRLFNGRHQFGDSKLTVEAKEASALTVDTSDYLAVVNAVKAGAFDLT